MTNTHKIITSSVVALVAIVAAGWLLSASKSRPLAQFNGRADMIFYYGDGCPHCANVEQYLTDHSLDGKINLVRKEIYNNQDNQAELINRALACGLNRQAVGIPLLWHDGQCLEGDQAIIDFFDKNFKY